MHRHVITTSSRPGDTVLDCFGGCCKVADVCRELGRHYIIIEAEEEYVKSANYRLSTTSTTLSKFFEVAA
jgi:modification methylase